jgi:hypothetical protein
VKSCKVVNDKAYSVRQLIVLESLIIKSETSNALEVSLDIVRPRVKYHSQPQRLNRNDSGKRLSALKFYSLDWAILTTLKLTSTARMVLCHTHAASSPTVNVI